MSSWRDCRAILGKGARNSHGRLRAREVDWNVETPTVSVQRSPRPGEVDRLGVAFVHPTYGTALVFDPVPDPPSLKRDAVVQEMQVWDVTSHWTCCES